ncbi:hypothetical protein [Paraburkholderia sediminicola]|uniref:hypothetical protein n=1 Tax=Paraburkholderia sediminicola TaxID=458836 RepID=UPI0038BE01FA
MILLEKQTFSYQWLAALIANSILRKMQLSLTGRGFQRFNPSCTRFESSVECRSWTKRVRCRVEFGLRAGVRADWTRRREKAALAGGSLGNTQSWPIGDAEI